MGADRKSTSETQMNVPPGRWFPRVPFLKLGTGLGATASTLAAVNRIQRDGLSQTLQHYWQFIVDHSWLVYGVVAVLAATPLCVLFWEPILLWTLEGWMGRAYCHFDQQHAMEDVRRWDELKSDHRRLLGVSLRELARACGLSIWVAWYLCRTRGRLPRPEFIDRFCDALYASREWLQGGDGYGVGKGKDYTVERLLRYHEMGLVKGWTKSDIQDKSELERQSFLRKVEKGRRKELALLRGNHE
jgi:hypothetical protein